MTIKTTTNGYKAEELQELINIFNTAVRKTFDDCKVEHFFYGDDWDMIDVILPNGDYAHLNLSPKRVSLSGWRCTKEEMVMFEQLTYCDSPDLSELNGRLLETAMN